MTSQTPRFGDGVPRGNPNCQECRGTGRIHSKGVRGLGSTRSPYGLHSEPCPTCFPKDVAPTPKPSPRLQPSRTKLSLVDQIIALAELHEAGVLTDEEFELAKKKLLNS